MAKRKLARPGLSYFDANLDRLVEVSGEVLDIKNEIRARWPSVNMWYDTFDEVWVLTVTLEDNTERLFMQRKELPPREELMLQIAKADPTHRLYEDPIEAVDRDNAQIEREHERRFSDQMGDAGERLLSALRKDGFDVGKSKVFIGSNREPHRVSDRT